MQIISLVIRRFVFRFDNELRDWASNKYQVVRLK